MVVAVVLAAAVLLGNIRAIIVCGVLAIGFGWYYERLPAEHKQQICDFYIDTRARCQRAWDAFWSAAK